MNEQTLEVLFMVGVLACAGFSLLSRDLRHTLISTWVAGIFVGTLLLARSMEYLAVTAWVISTAVTLGGIFFGVTFGEYGIEPKETRKVYLPRLALSLLVGFSFSGLIGYAGHSLGQLGLLPESTTSIAAPPVSDHRLFLLMIALGFSIFLSLVALGTITRLEKVSKEGEA